MDGKKFLHLPLLVVGSGTSNHHLALFATLDLHHVKVDPVAKPSLSLNPVNGINGIETFQSNKIDFILKDKWKPRPNPLSPIEKLLRNKKEQFSIVTIENTFKPIPPEYLENKI